MNRTRKDKVLDFLYSLLPLGELFLMAVVAIGYLLILVVIILHAQELGGYFVPALIGYLLPIFIARYFLWKRDAHNQIRALGGDELYADLYPREAAKAARKKKRKQEKAAHNSEIQREKASASHAETSSKRQSKTRDYRGPEF